MAKVNIKYMNQLLDDILKKPDVRKKLIHKFQNLIWEDLIEISNKDVQDLLKEMAYDLDFYEPDEARRIEDPSFFNDTELSRRIEATQKKINEIKI